MAQLRHPSITLSYLYKTHTTSESVLTSQPCRFGARSDPPDWFLWTEELKSKVIDMPGAWHS